MNLAELLSGVDITDAKADLSQEITGVSYDSRTTAGGNLFIAVIGFESDGHAYISTAMDKGAACVLCEQPPSDDIPYIQTSNTRRALAVVSANWFGRPADKLVIVGVTGTNGKTTTTTLIKNMLEHCSGEKTGLIGTNEIVIGDTTYDAQHTTPESYDVHRYFAEMLEAGCTYAVMEVSSHALILDRVYGIGFKVGVFTNLTHEHLDFHKTMDDYADAKARLFRQCEHAVINIDDTYGEHMVRAATGQLLTYSVDNDEADLVAKRVRVFPDHIDFCALTLEKLQTIELNIPGRFSIYNALAAVGVGLCLGLELPTIAEALGESKGVKGRLEVVPTGRDFTVVIDYAHKPFALENIIQAFKEFATGRVVTVFGCGGDRDKTKRPLMGEIAARLSDYVIVTSDNPRTEEPGAIIDDILAGMSETKTPYSVIENRKKAIGWAIKNAQPEDIIILAGKGHETYQIIGKEKSHFDEREIVREFLTELD